MRAVIFDFNHSPVKLLEGSTTQLDANTPLGYYWREVPRSVTDPGNAPDPATLPVYPERLVEPPEESRPIIPTTIQADNAGSASFTGVSQIKVTTSDGVEHVESRGGITIVFPGNGRQHIVLEEAGRAPLSYMVDVEFFSDYQRKFKKQVDRDRDTQMIQNIPYNGNTFDGDPTAQKNLIDAAVFGNFRSIRGNPNWSINWITADNTIVNLNSADLESITNLIAAQRETAYMNARAAKNSIESATTRAQVDAAYDAYLNS